MLRNTRPNAFGEKQQTERWFQFQLFIVKACLKKMELIRFFFMPMDRMAPIAIPILMEELSACLIVGLPMRLHTFGAARNWEDNGLKMEDCSIRKIHLPILSTVRNFW